ncbi:putative methyltransferase NSUN7 [Ylistrum balloti]|uniref:putative methyltransferase NSUN7 n=1 Tax=Ylistrum balloti TaxID=509963 RepID=UPI002905ADCF|nr:putative methyltransferase NSUN7 [Ylistrum balloti]
MSPTAETYNYSSVSRTHSSSSQRFAQQASSGSFQTAPNNVPVKEDNRMRSKMSVDSVRIPGGKEDEENGVDDDHLDLDPELRARFFKKEPCLYSHQCYLKAAKVFSALKHDSKDVRENPYLKRRNHDALKSKVQDIPELNFQDDGEKRLSFELAFKALKFQMLYEEILDDCAFFTLYPEHVEDMGLVMVVLCDYQGRKFQLRSPSLAEELNPVAQQVEDAICDCKTKLNACFARHRIKASAPSVEHLLPDLVRSKEEIRSQMPMYLWVNQTKLSVSEAMELFKDEGFTLVGSDDCVEGQKFSVDSMCTDVFQFPPDKREYLLQHDLVMAGKVVLQDKSSSIAPHSVKYLLGEDSDVIHVNVGSGMTTAHLASLMQAGSGHVWAFGNRTSASQFQQNMEKLGIKGVKMLTEPFLSVEPDDTRFKNVKVILITADCSKSGITNPIDFIVNEGEDMKILKDLSVGETDESKLGELAGQHNELLKHAMKFNKAQAVVYMTRSIHELENENVVSKSTEYINMLQKRSFPYRVVPPVLPFTGEAIENKMGIHGKHIKFFPTEKTSGCFVTVITREPEDAKEAAKDVLARAQAKGLLSGKKQKEPNSSSEHLNGEVTEGLTNGDIDSKLLHKRSRKMQRRVQVRGTVSAPQYNKLSSYSKPHATSPIHSYITSTSSAKQRSTSIPHTTTRSAISIGSRLYHATTKNSGSESVKRNKPIVAEHVKVVKHPAPFR